MEVVVTHLMKQNGSIMRIIDILVMFLMLSLTAIGVFGILFLSNNIEQLTSFFVLMMLSSVGFLFLAYINKLDKK